MKHHVVLVSALLLSLVTLTGIAGLSSANPTAPLVQPVPTPLPNPLITKGMDVNILDAVGLVDSSVGGCTGALIGDRLVLTAAHCMCDQRDTCVTRARFTLFDVNLSTGGLGTTDFWGDVFVYPKAYRDDRIYNMDASLIVLDTSVSTVRDVTPMRLADPDSAGNGPVILVGFSSTGSDCRGPIERYFAPTTVVLVDDSSVFGSFFSTWLFVEPSGALGCHGDSGGPLLSEQGTILGVNSHGKFDGNTPHVTAIARVDIPSIHAWISCFLNNNCASTVQNWQIETYFDRGDSIAAGDIDGDGIPEILEAEDDGGAIRVYDSRMSYQGTFQSSYDRGGDRIAAGDINGDGRSEILVAEDDDGRIEVYADGRIIFTQSPGSECHTTFDGGDGLTAGDVDGDGIAEVIMAEDDEGPVGIYRAVISGSQVCYQLDMPVFRTSYDGGDALVAGDIDGDGRAEIIVLEDDGGAANVYEADGTYLGYISTTYDGGDSAASARVISSIPYEAILVAEDDGGRIGSFGP